MTSLSHEAVRRRRLLTRALPLTLTAAVALAAGLIVGAEPAAELETANRFTQAWARGDFTALRAELDPASQRRYSAAQLRESYADAQEVSTLRSLDPGEPQGPDGGVVTVPLVVGTVAFGDLQTELRLPFRDGGVVWAPHLVFPGLAEGEELAADIELSRRGSILARDGTPLAEGPPEDRSSPLGSAAVDVTGEVGEAEGEEVAELARQGFAPGTLVGVSGLERALNTHLAGKPGGRLLAAGGAGGERVLAESRPQPGEPAKTTIDPDLQQAAVAALAGRSGGVAVLDARNGAVRALAGSAYLTPQPPGSTFKLITTTAALQAGAVALDDEFPVVDGANVGGRFIANAHDELCGGSFVESFAHSCNSVFAPLGAEVGNDGLVSAAERFGFNAPPTLYDERAVEAIDPPEPSIPTEVGDDLDLGVSAIGQGEVLATPLIMASAAQTVAARGVRSPTPIVSDPDLQAAVKPVRVMSPKIANQLRELMIAVVTSGTGVSAAIAEGQVAGKTGTAELGPDPGAEVVPGEDPPQILDAWFTAFAPAQKPRLAAAALLVDSEADGGEVAAPLVAEVLSAGL